MQAKVFERTVYIQCLLSSSPLTSGFWPISKSGMAFVELTNDLLLKNSIHVFQCHLSFDSSAAFVPSATPPSSKFYFHDFRIFFLLGSLVGSLSHLPGLRNDFGSK